MNALMIVTGTSKGIGFDIAKYYLELGWTVAGCSRSVSSINSDKYIHFELDVADEKKVVEMVRNLIKDYGKIDALVNNAGISSMNPLLLAPLESAQSIMQTNFMGSFLFCREVGKQMIRKKSGRIINLTTVARPMRLEGEALYAASKAAIESMTEILSKEMGPCGVTINNVGPTPIKTDLTKGVPDHLMQSLLDSQGISRWGTSFDVTNVIDFFLKKESDFITGQTIYLGGVHG